MHMPHHIRAQHQEFQDTTGSPPQFWIVATHVDGKRLSTSYTEPHAGGDIIGLSAWLLRGCPSKHEWCQLLRGLWVKHRDGTC